jgi:signal transduction histidine kinase
MFLFFVSRKKIELMVAKRAAEACERIMEEMSIDMHDSMRQRFVVIEILMDRLKRSIKDRELDPLVFKLQRELTDLNEEARVTMRRLLPSRTKNDTLEDMIRKNCGYMELPGVTRVEFTPEGEPVPLGTQVERYIFRIVQELMQNAFKHSSVWRIRVLLQWQPGTLTIEVEDDGTRDNKINKFIRHLKEKHNSLKMRTLAIGASIDYKRGEKGLLAIVRLPLPPKPN